MISNTELNNLLKICSKRERVAKAQVGYLAASLKSDFEARLAADYHYDQQEIWKEAHAKLKTEEEEANKRIAARSREMGIPAEFAPSIHISWYGRGENAVKNRRAELTKVAYAEIDQREKKAKLDIERSSCDFHTRLLAGSLESAEAKAFLKTMPSPAELLLPISVDDAKRLLGNAKNDTRSSGHDL